MKYVATIDTDEFKDFKFFEDANGKYLVARDAGADEWMALHFTEIDMRSCFQCIYGLRDIGLYPCKECHNHSYFTRLKEERMEDNMRDRTKTDFKDAINPDHYKNQTSLECIEAMILMFGEEAVLKFCMCNAYKYIWRHVNKNGQEDLKKASWYINRAWNIINYCDAESDCEEKIQLRRMEAYVVDHREDMNG